MQNLTHALSVFVKVAEHASFAAAARELNLANSTVTRYVGQLEKHLGTPLFVRTTRHVRLSNAGERTLDRAREILKQVDELAVEARPDTAEISGTLRLSVPWRYARLYVAPFLGTFMSAYPQVRLEVVSDDRMVDLVEDGFDVAIRIGRLRDSSLIARKLADQSFVLAAAPSYLARFSAITSHLDLAEHTILAFAYTASTYHWKLKKGANTYRISAREGRLHSNNADLITRAAVDGGGIVVQPDWAVQNEMDSGTLTRVLSDYDVTSTSFQTGVYVVYPKENRDKRCVRAWVEFVTEWFRALCRKH